MASYTELTSEQQELLQAFLNFARAWVGEQARAFNHADVAKDAYTSQIASIMAQLDAGSVLPNSSGLDGAQSITKEELGAVVTAINGMLTSYNTTAIREAWTKLCGLTNMIG